MKKGIENKATILYHGTNKKIIGQHLMPQTVDGRDKGDPSVPVIFATHDIKFASIFSIKTKDCIAIGSGEISFAIIKNRDRYLQKLQSGSLINVPSKNFKQLIFDGRKSIRWVSYEPVKIDVSNVITISLEYLLSSNVQIFFIDINTLKLVELLDEKGFLDKLRSHLINNTEISYLKQLITKQVLIHENQQRSINPLFKES